jgi:glycosyltransferase involved in cell wall biosynthesis
MRILFIIPSYKPAYIYGGTIVVIAMLAEQLVLLGHEVTVYTTTANGENELEVEAGKEIDVEGVRVIYFKRLTGDHTHVSPALWKMLNTTVKKFDVVHIHSWWSALVIGAAWICKKNGVKPVLSPHGMFSNYILETNNSSKKRWIQKLMGKELLKNSWLHVSTEMEWEESQKIVPDWEGRIVPNLVRLSHQTYVRKQNDIFTIGFLSRMDPKKGLDILIKALAKVHFEYRLLVAGSGEETYLNFLKQLSVDCGNADKIKWLGWKSGEDKFEFLSELDLFALTSHSENFAIVIIESLSVGTPVFISEHVGLYKYISQNDYGWVTDMNVDNIVTKLNEVVTEKQKLSRINATLPDLIRKEFDGSTLTKEYIKLYNMVTENKSHSK